ncbi:hypothetical protein [Streptomyces sp. NPDC002845]
MGGGHRQARHPTEFESVYVTWRSPAAEAKQKAENEHIYGPRRGRAAKAKTEPATAAQLKYLATLTEKAGREQFDAAFTEAVKGTSITPRALPRERTATTAKRRTKTAARTLISALAGG